jgi:hypothetical protein
MAENVTKIADCRGDEHAYNTDPFPGSESWTLMLEVLEVLGGPVGTVLQTVLLMLQQAVRDGKNPEGLQLADVDLSGINIPEMMQQAPGILLEKGGPDFLRRILARTRRCSVAGKKAENKDFEDVGDLGVFDRVYAGNIWEAGQAALWAMGENWAPFSADGTRSWTGLLTLLGSDTPGTPKTSQAKTRGKRR